MGKVEQGPDGSRYCYGGRYSGGGKLRVEADLVVLATGMEPSSDSGAMVVRDELNFLSPDTEGTIATGVAARPMDVTTSIQGRHRRRFEGHPVWGEAMSEEKKKEKRSACIFALVAR